MKQKQNRIYYYDIDIKEDMAWIPIYGLDSICCMDIKTGKIREIETNYHLMSGSFYDGIYKMKKGLVVSQTQNRKKLFYYDECNSRNNYVMQLDYDVILVHDRVFEFNGCLYIFALQAVIIKVNILSHEIEYFFYKGVKADTFLGKPVVRNGNKVYILQKSETNLLIFDLEKNKFEVKKTDLPYDLETMCLEKQELWFTNNKGELLSFSLNTNKVKKKDIDLGKELYGQVESFCKSFFFNESVWLIPTKIDCIIKYNVTTESFARIVCPKDCQVPHRKNSYKYISVAIYKNFLFLLDCASEKIYRLDMLSAEIMPIEIEWNIDLLKHNFVNEGDLGISLETFLQRVRDTTNN